MVIEIPLSKKGKYAGLFTAIVDDVDADLAQSNWSVVNQRYAQKNYPDNKKGYMHRIVLERVLGRKLEHNEDVDHINEIKLDNRRENLRLATRIQNSANRGKNKNNTTGYKGVMWLPKRKQFIASIKFNYKRIQLGYFTTAEEAHEAYKAKAIELHGEFAKFE
jgi:hypothetical protein